MSTTQDHNNLASLQDIFGPGAGESGTLGNQGSSGETGSTGSPGFQAVNVIGQGVNVLTTKKAIEAINNVLSNPNATRADLQGVLDQGNSAKYTAKSMAKLGDIATGVGYAGAAAKVLGGELGTGGSAAVTGLKTAVPGVGMASGLGSLLGKYDPINPLLNKGAELVNELPYMKYANRGLQNLGTGISKIPGTGTASRIFGGLSEVPDMILSVPAQIWRSFGDEAKAAAKSSREFALNDMFEEYAKNDPYSTPPGGWVRSRVVPGGYGEGQYDETIPFQAHTKDLWEEYKNTDSYKTVLTAQQGIRDLEEIRGQEALKKLQSDRAISELTDPVQNIVPVSAHAEWGMGTHYADEYGTYDVKTGEKIDVPNFYEPEPGFPVLEPIPFEAPTADPYQAPKAPTPVRPEDFIGPKAPTPVETAPLNIGVNPMKRVRPEDFIGPLWPDSPGSHYSKQIQSAPQQGLSRYEQDMAAYELSVKQEADRVAARNHRIASNGYAAPGMGWNFGSGTNTGFFSAPTTPKHKLRDLPTFAETPQAIRG